MKKKIFILILCCIIIPVTVFGWTWNIFDIDDTTGDITGDGTEYNINAEKVMNKDVTETGTLATNDTLTYDGSKWTNKSSMASDSVTITGGSINSSDNIMSIDLKSGDTFGCPTETICSQTGEGEFCWDSDNDYLTIGDGTSSKKIATTTGTLTNGNCVEIDVNGNFVDAGAACGTSSGSLTVEATDGTPSVSSVDTIQFNETDGFSVTDMTGGTAQIGFTPVEDSVGTTELDDASVSPTAGYALTVDSTDTTKINYQELLDAGSAVLDSDFTANDTFMYATTSGTPQPKTSSEVKTILGLNTTDSPTFLGITVSGMEWKNVAEYNQSAQDRVLMDGDFSFRIPESQTYSFKIDKQTNPFVEAIETIFEVSSTGNVTASGNLDINGTGNSAIAGDLYVQGTTLKVGTVSMIESGGDLAFTGGTANGLISAETFRSRGGLYNLAITDLATTTNDTISSADTNYEALRISTTSGVVYITEVEDPADTIRELTILGTSDTNYPVISDKDATSNATTGINLVDDKGYINMTDGAVLKLVWVDTKSYWQETFSYEP